MRRLNLLADVKGRVASQRDFSLLAEAGEECDLAGAWRMRCAVSNAIEADSFSVGNHLVDDVADDSRCGGVAKFERLRAKR